MTKSLLATTAAFGLFAIAFSSAPVQDRVARNEYNAPALAAGEFRGNAFAESDFRENSFQRTAESEFRRNSFADRAIGFLPLA